jgi:hypothetical protein
MEAFSWWRRVFREVSQVGLPSPVSRRRRVGPWPIRYVFVPVFEGEALVSLWILNRMFVFCDTLKSELVGILLAMPDRIVFFVGNRCASHFSWVAA